MTPSRLLVAALLGTALALPALADDGPTFVPTLRRASALSKERGAPILIWMSGDKDADEKADLDNLKNREVLQAMRGYLVLFATPEEVTHKPRDGTLDGKPAKVCSLVPSITCEAHKVAWAETYQSYADQMADKTGNVKVPNHFVVGPDGKVLGTINNGTLAAGFSVVAPAVFVKGLKDLLAKAGGPGLSDEQYASLQAKLQAARVLVEGGRLKEAARALRDFEAIKKNIAIVQDARDLLKKADAEATAALSRARSMLGEDPVGGLAALEQVAEDYPGTESAGQARKTADDFKGSPAGKKALADLAREKLGRGELQKALDLVGKDDGRAMKALDAVAKKYAGLPSGREAEAKAAEMRADPALVARVQAAEEERAAKGALTQARGLLDAGKKAEAATALKALVEKWPATEAAKEANRLLEGLR